MGKKAAKKDDAQADDAAEEGNEVQTLPEDVAQGLAQYDLTAKMSPFMDRHFLLCFLNFARESGIYKSMDVTRAEFSLICQMNMVDYAMEKCTELGELAPRSGFVPDHLNDRKEKVLTEVHASQGIVYPLLQMLEDEEMVRRIPGFKTLNQLCADFKIDESVVHELLRYAKLQYECGEYNLGGALLKHYRSFPKAGAEDGTPQAAEAAPTSKDTSCIWGSLASALLTREFDEATRLILELDERLTASTAPKKEILVHRTWLLHWSLFVIFSAGHKVEVKLLVEYFLNEKSLSIISLACPHLFRYVGACLILQKRLKHLVKDTVWVIHHEAPDRKGQDEPARAEKAGSYSDPITRFLLALYTEMDYDDAQRELQSCEQVCKGDYFLAGHWAEFQENARLLVFESYCRIHQCINIEMLASKLNMQPEEAELWIVKLIQNAKLDARIDSEKCRVVMTKAPPNVYQQVIEKTKNLAFRSTMLVSNLEKGEKKDGN